MRRSIHGRALPALVSAALLAAGCGDGRDETADPPEPAPDYAAETLDGEPVSLAQFQDEVVLLNVWATWCIPCRREIPELQELHERHGDRGLRVIGVTVDSRRASDDVHRFIEQLGMTYDVWWDPDQTVLATFRAFAVPLTVLIDRDGLVRWRKLGTFERGDPGLLAALEEALS